MARPSATRLGVPAGAILVGEPDERAVGVGARVAARLGQQHQREQPRSLRLIGHQLGQQPGEPDGLGAQVGARELGARRRDVALIEDQVEHGEHRVEALGQVALVRHPVGDARVADLRLRPDDPLRHRRLGDEEGACDLGRRQPAEQAQGERHLGGPSERRMAAGEHEPQPVVGHGAFLDGLGRDVHDRGLGVLVRAGRLAAQLVDGPVAGGGDDPAGRAGRRAFARPALQGGRERVGDRILGQVDVAQHADEDRDGPAVLGAEDRRDLLRRHRIRRAGRPGTGGPRSAAWSRPPPCGPSSAPRPGRAR